MSRCARCSTPPWPATSAPSLELRLDDQRFRAELADGRLEVVRGEARSPDAVVETDPPTFLDLIRGRRDLAGALASGDVRVEGDERAVSRFLGLFPLPEPAPVAGRARFSGA